MAKGGKAEDVQVFDPGKIMFHIFVSDAESKELERLRRATNEPSSLRELLYHFIGLCEAVEHQRPLQQGDSIPLFTFVVEAYLEPNQR